MGWWAIAKILTDVISLFPEGEDIIMYYCPRTEAKQMTIMPVISTPKDLLLD